ncbi:hypothetical protein FACS1894105_03860 [Clostridia bacterium]|nr:hypothetical protein FACS1894105_03860 [Clostridia bacterium]
MTETNKQSLLSNSRKLILTITLITLTVVLFIAGLILLFANTTNSKMPDNNADISVQVRYESINKIFAQTNEEVSAVSTKYNVLYKDGQNRQMFIFSVPVRESDNSKYILYDNKIYKNSDGTFGTRNKEFNISFENNMINMHNSSRDISIHLEGASLEKEDEYLNIYGENREAIKYNSTLNESIARFIPTYNGVLMEIILQERAPDDEIEFKIDLPNMTFENDQAGYVQILKNNEKVALIFQGIVVDDNNKFYPNNKVNIKSKNNERYLALDLTDISKDISYPAKIAITIDLFADKMFFDTSVYEATPHLNTISNNVSIFDTINDGKDGYTYMKYNVKSFTPKESSLIDSFNYSFYTLIASGLPEIEVYRVDNDWCSWTLNWIGKPAYKEKIGEITLSENGWHTIDLTDYVKKLIGRKYDNLESNSIMFKIKDDSKGYAIIASADSTYAPPYFEVNYRVS